MVHLDARPEHLLPGRAVGAPRGALLLGHPQEDDGADEEAQDEQAHHRDEDDEDQVGVVPSSRELQKGEMDVVHTHSKGLTLSIPGLLNKDLVGRTC